MFTRSKLRKILSKYRKEFEKDFFRKNQIQQTQEHMLTESIQNKYIVKDLSENSENDDASLENNGKDNATVNRIELVKAQNFINDKRKLNNIHPEKNFDANIKDYKNLDIFHRAVWPVMLLGQCFAVMPIVGIYHYNPRRMYFAFKSIQMLVTAIFLVASSLLTCSMTKYLMKVGVNAKNFVGFVFFATAQLACVLFLSLAKRWPRLIQYWTRTELIFTHPPYEELKRNLKTRVRLAAFLLICFSLFEHMLYLISAVLSYKRRAQICATAHNVSGHISFDTFIQSNYDYVFRTFNYNKFVGVFILMVNGACTFIWNYMDLFIMMVSKGIAYRFEQITLRIKKIADKDISENVFVEIREHYVKVCELLDYVDENLSGIILLSCVNNLYFVCYQLLNIFNKLRWPINYIYFWYSLLFLIGRTAFVFLTAAAINDQSKGALGTLRCVSNKTWCIEIERLIFQMTTQTVALSGKKFYFLTRRLLFGMAGTIITYELVLLQFDEPNRSKGLTPLCD